MGFRLKQVMAISKLLIGLFYEDDINLIACCCLWMEKDTHFPTISLDLCIMLEFGL
jgi:hypothetical protein